ncbi:hapless 8 [Prunus dulcis]|uniref:Hapless 8 n=1 Tax=Prunus dulcis TaxID=3755 RepID=A0A4Y1QNV6_PRUDU|nr:hapless 8 [Prunus dulcis]
MRLQTMFISSAASYALCQPTAFSFMAGRYSHHGFYVSLAEIVFHFEALSAEHNDGYLERGQLHGLSGTVTILGCMGLRSLSCIVF